MALGRHCAPGPLSFSIGNAFSIEPNLSTSLSDYIISLMREERMADDASLVAAALEVPAGTVKYRLHMAREKLSERLMTMVEEVLKEESPKTDFAERVFQLLDLHGSKGRDRWSMRGELGSIAADGVGCE
jgi:hypothetical protein